MIGDRIREARLARGMTQEKLSAATSIQTSHICRFERTAAVPSCRNLVKLADALFVTTDYLLGRTDVHADTHMARRVASVLRDLADKIESKEATK